MKKTILALSLTASVLSTAAFAAQLCGVVGTRTVGPNCQPGAACPQFIRLEYTIGGKLVSTGSDDVLTQLGELKGSRACAQGEEDSDGSFSITSISAE